MIYISIDTETGGLDHDKHSFLEFAAIIENTNVQLPFDQIPKFTTLLERPDDTYIGSSFALAMHKEIFTELAKKPEERTEKVIPFYDLGKEFYQWIYSHNPELCKNGKATITVAGKNFGVFDERFLENNPNFEKYIQIKSRQIDPAVFFFNNDTDQDLPNLSVCKERAGLKNTSIKHRALDDAWDVIEVLRGKLYSRNLVSSKNLTSSIVNL